MSMKDLATAMEKAGFQNVSTYINSGNIIFESDVARIKLATLLTQIIQKDFSVTTKVLVLDEKTIATIAAAIPEDWANDSTMKCDVMFLWDKYADKSVLEKVVIKLDIDNVKYVDGSIIWMVHKSLATRSGMMKLHGTDLYKHMTIRNCNTVRKLNALLKL